MKVEITSKHQNKLLNRTEVKGRLTFDQATPTNAQLTEALAKELKKDAALVIIKSIYTEYGKRSAEFFGLVYDSLEAKTKIERQKRSSKKKAEGQAAEGKEKAPAKKPAAGKGE
ncbi:MAG TPA: hypothetical protein VJG49_02590 [Candidatus Nanoarchaeia archaeon]|nr:hypothetical protein [Candidatus Nanoarchaeia archaeon]